MMSLPTRIWNGLALGGANSITCVPASTIPALPNGTNISTRYTLTGMEGSGLSRTYRASQPPG